MAQMEDQKNDLIPVVAYSAKASKLLRYLTWKQVLELQECRKLRSAASTLTVQSASSSQTSIQDSKSSTWGHQGLHRPK